MFYNNYIIIAFILHEHRQYNENNCQLLKMSSVHVTAMVTL